MKNRLITLGIYILMFVILWNLLDLCYCKLISRSDWSFSPGNNILYPAVFGVMFSFLTPLINRIGKKK